MKIYHNPRCRKSREGVQYLTEKGVLFERTQTRVYPHRNLFSHVIGQIDEDHDGISGIEKSFNYQLKSDQEPLITTLDTNIQFLIREIE